MAIRRASNKFVEITIGDESEAVKLLKKEYNEIVKETNDKIRTLEALNKSIELIKEDDKNE